MPNPLESRRHTSLCAGAHALGIAAVLTLAPSPALAALGGDVRSVQADAERLGGARTVTAAAGWELHTITLPSGTVVHEYLASGSRVFAIAWSGRAAPNLRQLMGDAFDAYVSMLHGRRGGHHAVSVSDGQLVVQAIAHNHSFSGRAWNPAALPTGFDARTVR